MGISDIMNKVKENEGSEERRLQALLTSLKETLGGQRTFTHNGAQYQLRKRNGRYFLCEYKNPRTAKTEEEKLQDRVLRNAPDVVEEFPKESFHEFEVETF